MRRVDVYQGCDAELLSQFETTVDLRLVLFVDDKVHCHGFQHFTRSGLSRCRGLPRSHLWRTYNGLHTGKGTEACKTDVLGFINDVVIFDSFAVSDTQRQTMVSLLWLAEDGEARALPC